MRGVRRKLSRPSYSEYLSRRSCSKSSHQIQPGRGVAHSAGTHLSGTTVIVVLALRPSAVATTWATPGASALTMPSGETWTMDGLALVHCRLRSASACPREFLGTPRSRIASLGWSVSRSGSMLTEATGSEERIGTSEVPQPVQKSSALARGQSHRVMAGAVTIDQDPGVLKARRAGRARAASHSGPARVTEPTGKVHRQP